MHLYLSICGMKEQLTCFKLKNDLNPYYILVRNNKTVSLIIQSKTSFKTLFPCHTVVGDSVACPVFPQNYPKLFHFLSSLSVLAVTFLDIYGK